MQRLTPSEALDMDCTALADLVCNAVEYMPTDGEIAALAWLKGRYAVADVLWSALLEGAITVEPYDVACALRSEGLNTVPCLDDNTALQRIVFCIGPADWPARIASVKRTGRAAWPNRPVTTRHVRGGINQ